MTQPAFGDDRPFKDRPFKDGSFKDRGGNGRDALPFDRLPPHSIDAEKCLLASMMLDRECIGEVVQQVSRDAFYLADHQIIFDILLKLYEKNDPVDAVILRDELRKRQQLDEVGGTGYIAEILGTIPSAAHYARYCETVRETALLRQMIGAANEILRDAYGAHEDADDVLDRSEKLIFDIAEQKVGSQIESLGEVAMQVYEMLEDRGRRGVETDYYELDEMLNGLQKEELIIVAARPSMGKTAFAMNVVEHVAARQVPAAVFSLEMSRQQLAQRMMCSRAQIDAQKVRTGRISTEEFQRLAMVANELGKFPVWVDDTPGLTVMDLRAKARRLKRQHDIQLIMIDYMQLMEGPKGRREVSRQQEITEISRGIKAVARELKVPVVCLSQLNRSSESREGHRPRMSDLRESGSIEQDADVIMLLHREDYYRMSEPDFEPDNIAEVIVAKQRNGPTGTVKLTFDNKTTTFKNLASQIYVD
ncbi:MAG: replicative DNA helicase [Phycisphaerae bacterium]